MLEESGFGLYIAYAAVGAFLILVVVLFTRVALMMSLLWIVPVSRILRRLPGLRRLLPP